MKSFVYRSNPSRVTFGSGTLNDLRSEVDLLNAARPFIVATPQQAKQASDLAAMLPEFATAQFTNATMHTPLEVTERAMIAVQDHSADCVIAIGGGSTIGLSKAIAFRTDLPQIVIPTTYAGSEMTPILGETNNGVKTTISDARVLPEVVIYDVDLTLTLPPSISSVSGLNAIAHAVEALYAKNGNPVIQLIATDGIRALANSLPQIVKDPTDPVARSDALYGAWLCGMCLGSVGMALHHKLCHTVGGSFDLPHAEVHSVILAHATAFNSDAAPEAMAAISHALGTTDAATGLFNLAQSLGVPTSLRAIGMPEDGISPATDLAMANPYWNPRPLEKHAIRELITRAYHGHPPLPASHGGP